MPVSIEKTEPAAAVGLGEPAETAEHAQTHAVEVAAVAEMLGNEQHLDWSSHHERVRTSCWDERPFAS